MSTEAAPAHQTPAGSARAAAGHLPSLDGLRGISILLVLLGHMSGTRNFIVLPKSIIGDVSHLGVSVFFAISGFLITTLLMAEHAKRGRISLKLFYARRAIRIFPASYLLLAVVAILWRAGWIQLHPNDLWYAAFYVMNHLPERSWEVGHLWSLSVEEQFYLVWPFTFAALGMKRSAWAAVAMLVLAPVCRLLSAFLLRGTVWQDAEFFVKVADSLGVGCLLALWREPLEAQRWYLRLLSPAWSLAVLAMVVGIHLYQSYTIVNVAGASLVNAGLAVLVHRSVYHWQDGFGHTHNMFIRRLPSVGKPICLITSGRSQERRCLRSV